MASTRDFVLEIAQGLVQREGVSALTIDRIAREAGISKGGLLYHFASKEQLVEACVQRLTERLAGARTSSGRALVQVAIREAADPNCEIATVLMAGRTGRSEILGPLLKQYEIWRRGVNSGTEVAWLAAQGLLFCEQFGLINFTPGQRRTVVKRILGLTEETNMREESGFIQPASAAQPVRALAEAHSELRELAKKAGQAAAASARSLATLQSPEGYWAGNLTADTTLESDYVLLQLWLYPANEKGWNPPSKERIGKALGSVLDRQLTDGGWNIYEGGPSELNATVRAYTALRLGGFAADHPALKRARERILSLGGLQAANSYTKINLSLFGLFPAQFAPSVPPELLLIPGNLLYEMSSWTRAIIVPLSIIQALGARRPAPAGISLEELYMPGKKLKLPVKDRVSAVFNQADRAIKLWERRGIKDVRAKAIREAEKWMFDHLRFSDGLGAIYPSMMYSIMAMDALGYERDHPDLAEAIRQFDGLILETPDRLEFQPCKSPIWDTAIALFALGELGEGQTEAARRAADWILDKEVRRKGDWSVKRPALPPGGWAFEFANEYYPDIDDTAMVLLALEHVQATDPERQQRAEQRAIAWLLGMQSSDGGWAAFDVDNNWQLLNKVPFADHNAMLDPTCPDITGRVMEALCRRGMSYQDAAIARAVDYLLAHQKEDGSWYGRWGVNYVYGSFLAMRGLRASGSPAVRESLEKAVAWLRSVQNADGGWGESCASYEVHRFVPGPSTASQTAWGLLGLEAAGDIGSAAARRGVEWLLARQTGEGKWEEDQTTGTGFPNVFYLTYHLYRHYFPLLALAAWKRAGHA